MYSSGNASNRARLRFPPQHVQFLLALVLVLLPFSLDLAYCRSFATLWSVAVLSVSNLNSVWVQASIPHTGLAPLVTPRITGLCWRHAGTLLQHLALPLGLKSSIPARKRATPYIHLKPTSLIP